MSYIIDRRYFPVGQKKLHFPFFAHPIYIRPAALCSNQIADVTFYKIRQRIPVMIQGDPVFRTRIINCLPFLPDQNAFLCTTSWCCNLSAVVSVIKSVHVVDSTSPIRDRQIVPISNHPTRRRFVLWHRPTCHTYLKHFD